MNLIRRILFIILSEDSYLRVVSKMFLILYRSGVLWLFRKFQTHYLVKKLINKGDIIIDIGANLGYYSSIFARETGEKGRVIAVEPIPFYRKILMSNTKSFNNIELVPFALGDKNEESVMGIPSEDKYRHGLTRILEKNEHFNSNDGYRVVIRNPETMFSNLPRLDYIKCDIEGYEAKVIPGFQKLISKFKPVIQIELDKNNFEAIDGYLTGLNYNRYIVSDRKLVSLNQSAEYSSDIIYIPENRKDEFSNIIKPIV